jgi:hypothetical protein
MTTSTTIPTPTSKGYTLGELMVATAEPSGAELQAIREYGKEGFWTK